MRFDFTHGTTTVDGAAAAVLAGAVGYAAFGLGTALLALVMAPLAFVVTCAGLGRIGGDRLHRLAEFELLGFDAPSAPVEAASDDGNVVQLFERSGANPAEAAAGDARQALSDAFERFKQSLR